MAAACLLSVAAIAQEPARLRPDPPKVCSSCDAWNGGREPFRVHGNTYFVGVAGLSSVLIASPEGHILLDGALPQSAAPIDASIRALGFRTTDIRLIAVSHAHHDHAGGVAALQRASGAIVAAGAGGARALEAGVPTADDPQYGLGREAMEFPPVGNVRVVADGETLRVGPLAITAHLTPGHTPGSTSWSWPSCDGPRCVDVVYADSLNAVSADGFRFGDDPPRVAAFRRGIERVRRLPCDVLLSVHPEFSNLDGRLRARREGVTPDPFIDATACGAYADAALRALERRLRDER